MHAKFQELGFIKPGSYFFIKAMVIPQNTVIVGLGILLSFLLFTQGEKYNAETTQYGQLMQECKALKLDYESCVVERSPEIRKKYGMPYWDLQLRKIRQKTFLINPCVILIIVLFVGFGVSRKEIMMTFIALIPISLVFLKNADSIERTMGSIYLLFALTIAYSISRVKFYLFIKNP